MTSVSLPDGLVQWLGAANQLPLKEKYIIASTIFAVRRNHELLITLLGSAKQDGVCRTEVYEAFLMLHLFAGFPAALDAHSSLAIVFTPPEEKLETEPGLLYGKGMAAAEYVYGDNLPKLIANVEQSSPDLAHWMITDGYGKIFARPGLPFRSRELTAVAALAVLAFEKPLYSHMRGFLRQGGTATELNEALEGIGKAEAFQAEAFARKIFLTLT